MKQFRPEWLIHICTLLGQIEGAISGATLTGNAWAKESGRHVSVQDIPLSQASGASEGLAAGFKELGLTCSEYGLPTTVRATQMAVATVRRESCTLSQANYYLQHCRETLINEMESYLYYSIDRDKQHFIMDDCHFGSLVEDNFPTAKRDIQGAAKCLAFECWTASVYHSMRVLESGLSVLAKHFNVAYEHRNWENIIIDIETAVKKITQIGKSAGSDWKEEERYYAGVTLQFRHFKNAYRNPGMHTKEHHDEEGATTMFVMVKDFMQHLAIRHHE